MALLVNRSATTLPQALAPVQQQVARLPTSGATSSAPIAVARAAPVKQATAAQVALAKRADALATEVRSQLARSGFHLGGTLELSVDTRGDVVLNGSAKDRSALGSALAKDRTRPSLASRLGALTKEAQALATAMAQSSTQGRPAQGITGNGAGIALYTSLLKDGAASAKATLRISSQSSAVTYSGALQVVV